MTEYRDMLWEMLHSPLILFVLAIMLVGVGYIIAEEIRIYRAERARRLEQHSEG